MLRLSNKLLLILLIIIISLEKLHLMHNISDMNFLIKIIFISILSRKKDSNVFIYLYNVFIKKT